jgi:hypothetical protein
MIKKVTTIISGNNKNFMRKARVIGGVVLGIGIGLLLNKTEENEVVIVGEVVDDNNYTYRPIEDLSEDELKRADENTAGGA